MVLLLVLLVLLLVLLVPLLVLLLVLQVKRGCDSHDQTIQGDSHDQTAASFKTNHFKLQQNIRITTVASAGSDLSTLKLI